MALLWTLHADAPDDALKQVSKAIFSHVRSQIVDPQTQSIACLVHEEDRLVAGGSGRTEAQRLFVHNLWVAEDHRRQGIASRLLRELEAEAARRGCRDAIIETLDDSVAAFYQRLGYRLVARLPRYLGPCDRHTLLKSHLARR